MRPHLFAFAAIAAFTAISAAHAAERAANEKTFGFQIRSGEDVLGDFAMCTGMGTENEVVEHRVIGPGGVEQVIAIPGRLRNNAIECWRPLGSELRIWDWREQVADGDIVGARMDVFLEMINPQTGVALASWTLADAWPYSISAVLDPIGGTTPVEIVGLVHQGIIKNALGGL